MDDFGNFQIEGARDFDIDLRAFDYRDFVTEPFDKLGVIRGAETFRESAVICLFDYRVSKRLRSLGVIDELSVERPANG